MKIYQLAEPMLGRKDKWLPSHMSQLILENWSQTKSLIDLSFYTISTQLKLLNLTSRNQA